MAKIERLTEVQKALQNCQHRLLSTEARDPIHPSVIVGYVANYAIHVHENLEALHGAGYNAAYVTETIRKIKSGKNKGQFKTELAWTKAAVDKGYHLDEEGEHKKPKLKRPEEQAGYLIRPARMMQSELAGIVRQALLNGATVLQALYIACLVLQRASQLIVPVETGNLKAGAFTRKE